MSKSKSFTVHELVVTGGVVREYLDGTIEFVWDTPPFTVRDYLKPDESKQAIESWLSTGLIIVQFDISGGHLTPNERNALIAYLVTFYPRPKEGAKGVVKDVEDYVQAALKQGQYYVSLDELELHLSNSKTKHL